MATRETKSPRDTPISFQEVVMARKPNRKRIDPSQSMLCLACGELFLPNVSATGAGRPPLYCSGTCRLRAWRARQSPKPTNSK